MPYKFVILAVIYLEMLIVSIQIQFVPPIVSLMIPIYNLNNTQCGILMGMFSVFGMFLCIPIGLFSSRIGYSRVTVLSFFLIIAGTVLMALTRNFHILCLSRMIAGIGIMGLAITLPSMLTRWFERSEYGKVMGFFNTAFPIGTVLSFTFLGEVAADSSVLTVIWGMVIIAVIGFVLFIILYRTPAEYKTIQTTQEKVYIFKFLKEEINVWLLGFIWLIYNGATVAFTVFGSVYFVKSGYSYYMTGLIASTIVYGAILSPVIGYLIDRGWKPSLILILGNSFLVLGFLFIYLGINLLFSLIILGIGAGVIATPVYYYVPRLVSPNKISISYGLVMAMLNAGIVIGPYLTGLVMDFTGLMKISFLMMAAYSVIGLFMAIKFNMRISPKDRKEGYLIKHRF